MSSDQRDFDDVIWEIAEYVNRDDVGSDEAYSTARLCLADSLACAFEALKYPACTRMIGPVVPGATLPGGVRVPGTSLELDPVQAAFCTGALIRWLDYNDTWLAAEWGHPSDNFGAILSVADYVSRTSSRQLTVRDVLQAAIKAYEVQGVLALTNSFNRVGLDHVLLVRIASTAVATQLLGGNTKQIANAVSNAWIDGGALRTYRHAPNTGSRKSWAAGDATSRAVRLAMWSLQNEMGYTSALSAKRWGFQDVLFEGEAIELAEPLQSYVMENILFKVSFPAEFHGQTAVEAALQLHPQVLPRLDEIESINIETQEAGVRIISKTGPLHNPADRDHCLQYLVAIPLIFGALNAAHYEHEVAADPRIDQLRDLMRVEENADYSRDYLDPNMRSITNAIQVVFKNGDKTDRVEVEYPIGHRRRRKEAIPLLDDKFRSSLFKAELETNQIDELSNLFADDDLLDATSIEEFMSCVSTGQSSFST